MRFDSMEELVRHGFQGFASIASLQASRCHEVPAEPGVYLVVRPDMTPPQFLDPGTGGFFKGKDPNVRPATLRSEWVDQTVVVYIGKAGGPQGQATLRSRLWQYMQYGQGKTIGHQGGRYIWQLADSAHLQICWQPTPNEVPAVAESRLIQEFKTVYGKRPFANLRD
ncbi:MAG: hypothetical protein H0U76_19035 [Ktedonobacteraceae bacterium]|nr:hypothetical protein [Ktedonobacteraceae bacterium]